MLYQLLLLFNPEAVLSPYRVATGSPQDDDQVVYTRLRLL
jgi:hypothetical protein